MNQQEYGLYVLSLIGEEPDAQGGMTEDELYGYFQSFMPEGQVVEKVFEPLEYGEALLARIRPIYEMLDVSEFEGEAVPGYFNGGRNDATQEHIQVLGGELIEGLLRLFAADPEQSQQAARTLTNISVIEVLAPGHIAPIFANFEAEDNLGSIIYETLTDVISAHTDFNETVEILSEAYYSIGCDYWLSYYLQWPRYRGLESTSDPLRPYAELYKLGYSVVFQKGKMLIGRR